MVRVIGDGVASVAVESVTSALDTTDVVDRSVARSTPASWLDLDDPAFPDEGANHGALAATLAEDPDLVLLSLGSDLVPSTDDADLQRCQPVTAQTIDGSPGGPSSLVVDCVLAVLEARHYRQRVMAVAFDVLAHTRNARLVVVGSGGDPGTIGGILDGLAESAVAAVAEAGATWNDRIAWSASPATVADVLRQRGWV